MTDPQMGGRPSGAGSPASRQVSWLEVYTFAERVAAGHGLALDHHLAAGTPQWCGMPDDDARKLLAVILGGVRDALRNDTHQAELADASKAIAASADWHRVGRPRPAAYITRRTA